FAPEPSCVLTVTTTGTSLGPLRKIGTLTTLVVLFASSRTEASPTEARTTSVMIVTVPVVRGLAVGASGSTALLDGLLKKTLKTRFGSDSDRGAFTLPIS